jgi:hypothetical protein
MDSRLALPLLAAGLLVATVLGGPRQVGGQVVADALSQSVEGVVLDADELHPVEGALLRLLDGEGEVVVSARSDSLGMFALEVSEPGAHRLEAERIGYLRREYELDLAPGERRRVEVRLTSAAVLLDPLLVTADPGTRPAHCSQQLITGRVVEEGASRGIVGAMVELLGREDRSLATARTDERGRFALVTPGPGAYRLRGSSEGHRESTGQELPLLPGDTIQVEFLLSADVALEAPVMVVGSARPWRDRSALIGIERLFHRTRGCQSDTPVGSRFGEFLDRSVIADWEGLDWPIGRMIAEESTGVWDYTPDGRITLFGGCSPLIIADGIPHRSPSDTGPPLDFLAFFTPETLEAVEVHRAPHVPREFWQEGESPCGVVALWGRVPEGEDPPTTAWRTFFGTGLVLGVLYLLK